MKFAFSTVGSDSPAEEVADAAKKFGFDGVELNFSTTVPLAFAASGVEVACVAGALGVTGRCRAASERAEYFRLLIDGASRIGCPLVKVTESCITRGQNRADPEFAVGDWILPLADYAADRAVSLVLDNTQSLRTAREIWGILDRLNHPSLGCCLDLLTAARIGESPQVAVPMLNSRIAYVQVRDVADLAEPSVDCDLGSAVVPIKTTIARLRGIGYSGWVSFRYAGPLKDADLRSLQAITFLHGLAKPMERAKARLRTPR